MYVNKRALTRCMRAGLKYLVLVLLIFTLESSVLAITCLEHLLGHAHQDHHTVFTLKSDYNTPASPSHTHQHAASTESSKTLECHLMDSQDTAQGGVLIPPLGDKMAIDSNTHLPNLQAVANIKPLYPLLFQQVFIAPPERPPKTF